MIWPEAGRIGLLLALWVGVALLRGPACSWGWGMAAEGIIAALAAWFASDGIAGYLLTSRRPRTPGRWAGDWAASHWP